MKGASTLLAVLIVGSMISGCFGGDDKTMPEQDSPFVFEQGEIPSTTWYHYPGTVTSPFAVDATDYNAVNNANITQNLSGNSIPFFAQATYYGTGWDTFEPTLGVTSSGAIFFTNYNTISRAFVK